jgi:hypothetical protein
MWARERQDDATLVSLAGLAAAIGMTGGLWVSRGILRRVDAMAQSVDHYAGGERGARIERSRHGGGDLDELAGALNSMMDRENRLVEGLRQASSAIAPDLRRPLAHHTQEIARALAGPPPPPATATHWRAPRAESTRCWRRSRLCCTSPSLKRAPQASPCTQWTPNRSSPRWWTPTRLAQRPRGAISGSQRPAARS